MDNSITFNGMKCIMNFEAFKLPFDNCQNAKMDDSASEYEDWLDMEFAKNEMESILPENALHLGSIETEIGEVQSTMVYDEYYLLSISDGNFNWAIFRLSWDDNREKWRWCFDARIESDIEDYQTLSKLVLTKLWDHWEVDWESDPSYSDLLGAI